jgi:mono/diheme cytochrome c family protein
VTEKLSRLTAAYFAAGTVTFVALTTPVIAQQPNTSDDRLKIDLGKVTYAQKCSHCHGPGMVNSGTITPDLRAIPNDRARFVTTVKQGKNGKMPPWGDLLSDEQIADVWAYVSSRRNP